MVTDAYIRHRADHITVGNHSTSVFVLSLWLRNVNGFDSLVMEQRWFGGETSKLHSTFLQMLTTPDVLHILPYT